MSTSLEKSYLVLVEFLMQSKKRMMEIGAAHGLTGMQAVTVLLLEDPRPMGAFRQIFNCDASNITGIIDGLEQKGLVARYDVETDRRVKMVKLKSKGKRTRSTLLRELTSPDDYSLSKLTPNEIETFIKLVRKITPSS